ncbi:MAG: hypothetical protein GC131_04480 [Alphaproteobacteria bacterium]|nr:hypothetical protein [Alphaproteobacteria bacterium]
MPLNMLHLGEFKSLPGGATVGVTRMNGADMVHCAVLGEVLYKVIESDARAHHTAFNGSGFNRVIDAIKGNEIHAYFIVYGRENDRPLFAGGALELPTVLTERNGNDFKHYPAVYCEDTYISPELSAEVRERTKTAGFPAGMGLGTYFTLERARLAATNAYADLPLGTFCKGRVAEYAATNKSIMGIYRKVCATFDSNADNSVLIFDDVAVERSGQMLVMTEALGLPSAGKITVHPTVFIASWLGDGGRQRIVASFTKSISSFAGAPVVRVQLTSNGCLPDMQTVKAVLTSLISAGKSEVMGREWLGGVTEAGVLSAMRFHALREPEIMSALRETGAKSRTLGGRPMLPVASNFSNIPPAMLGIDLPLATPFQIVPSTAEKSFLPDSFSMVA